MIMEHWYDRRDGPAALIWKTACNDFCLPLEVSSESVSEHYSDSNQSIFIDQVTETAKLLVGTKERSMGSIVVTDHEMALPSALMSPCFNSVVRRWLSSRTQIMKNR